MPRDVVVNLKECQDLDNITERIFTTWQGVRNETLNQRYVTDGSIIVDKKKVKDQELFDELCERKNNGPENMVELDDIRSLWKDLKKEKDWVAFTRGHVARPLAMANVKPSRILIVAYNNYQHHGLTDAHKFNLIKMIMGDDLDLRVGTSGNVKFYRGKELVAALALWSKINVIVE